MASGAWAQTAEDIERLINSVNAALLEQGGDKEVTSATS